MKNLWFVLVLALTASSHAEWRIVSEHDGRQPYPATFPNNGKPISVGDALPGGGHFSWLVATIDTPAEIEGQKTNGKTLGLQLSCGDGGEPYGEGKLQGRCDNDHPLLGVIAEKATPGNKIHVAVQV